MMKPFVYLEDQLAGTERLYTNTHDIITANTPQEVGPALKKMQVYQEGGQYLAGRFSYELGYLLDPVLQHLYPKNANTPLIQFGVFDGFERQSPPCSGPAIIRQGRPLWTQAEYQKRFEKVMTYIRAGDVYQINLSFPVKGDYTGSAAALYQMLKSRQPVRYGGVVSLGGDEIVSLSPELFFETHAGRICMRPMKGTSKRGGTDAEDMALAHGLQMDAKNRAENLMIVDLLRNDMSRLSQAGSVKVTDLFSVETFPTLHTMTSGIEAQLNDNVTLPDMLRALFPCGSITGAPKIRAQEIIDELETRPRGAYCGAIGLIDPNGDMRFNVGIRTLSLKADGTYTYPVGSGIVADSDGRAEYEECLLKAEFLQTSYGLIETIGWDKETGFMHLDLHLQRLQSSAQALAFTYDEDSIAQSLEACAQTLGRPHKIRMVLARDGQVDVTASPLVFMASDTSWPLSLCKNTVDSANPLLAHKTTERTFIDGERARLQAQTGCKEIVLFNEQGQICEGSFTNIFIVKDGEMMTPSLGAGLLPGILRRVLIEAHQVVERPLTQRDIITADEIYIGNSVRGLIPAYLLSNEKL